MDRDDRLRVEPQQPARTRAAFAQVALLERDPRRKAQHIGIFAVRLADLAAKACHESLLRALGESAREKRLHGLDEIEPVGWRAARVEFLLEERSRRGDTALRHGHERRLEREARKLGRQPRRNLAMPRGAHEVVAAAHGAGEHHVDLGVRRFDARELFEQLRRLGCASGREMDPDRLDRKGRGNRAAAELLGQQRGGLGTAVDEKQCAGELDAGANERRAFGDRAAEAMLGTAEVAARDEAARHLEMRGRRPFDRVEREVVGGLRLLVATEQRERADQHGDRGLALRVEPQRRLERGDRFFVAHELGEDQALGQARVARGREQRRRLPVELQRLVLAADRLERPAEVEHPVAAGRVAGDRGAQFALGIHEPALSEHLACAVGVMFTLP